MLVPHPRYIYILDYLEEMRFPDSSLVFYSLENIHVYVKFNVVLRKDQYEFHLECDPKLDDVQDYYNYGGEPSHNW